MNEFDLLRMDPEMEGPGEALLLARSPVFKIRYTLDGDLEMGCTVGCIFCYYRWVPVSRPYFGTGRLRPMASPQEMTTFLLNSRLFDDNAVLILGARGDASMYPDDLLKFLEIFPGPNLVLALHRPAADEHILTAFEDPRFRFGTTITPMGLEKGWTPVSQEAQVAGLAMLMEAGVDPDRVSVEVGPIIPETVPQAADLLRRLQEIGLRHVCIRGVSYGALGSDPEEAAGERQKLQRVGFLPGQIRQGDGTDGHRYYELKNVLPDGALDRLSEAAGGMRIHRRTYTLYRDVWGVRIAKNRANRVRIPSSPKMSPEEVQGILADYSLPGKVAVCDDHYFVELPPGDTATEDVAMVVGAQLDAAVIFNRYRRTAALRDVWFYYEQGLLDIGPYLGREMLKALAEAVGDPAADSARGSE